MPQIAIPDRKEREHQKEREKIPASQIPPAQPPDDYGKDAERSPDLQLRDTARFVQNERAGNRPLADGQKIIKPEIIAAVEEMIRRRRKRYENENGSQSEDQKTDHLFDDRRFFKFTAKS